MQHFIRLTILFAVFNLCTNSTGKAQNTETARPGPKGVFLFLGKSVPCGKPISAYAIERKASSGDWQSIAEVKAPETLDEMISRIEAANKLLPYQPSPKRARLQQIFNRAIQTGSIDSLKGFNLQYSIKMSLGLIYYDEGVTTGTGIQYRIRELNANRQTVGEKVSDTLNLPHKADFDEVFLAESSRTAKSVYIKWLSKGKNPGPLFMIHRMENNVPVLAGGTLGRYSLNDTTYYIFQDSLTSAQADKELHYFLTPFDQLGNSGKSSQVVAVTNDNFSKAYFIKTVVTRSPDKTGNKLSWYFSDPVTVKSMEIYRSEFPEKGYMLLKSLSANDTTFIDRSIKPDKSYFYYLTALSRSGKRFKQSDKIAALTFQPGTSPAPVILEVAGTAEGVRLLIQFSGSTAESYRVFRNNGVNDQLLSISGLIEKTDSSLVSYVDSSPELSGRYTYTYAVRSESKNSVVSELSNRVSIKPLLNSEPPRPRYIKAIAADANIYLFWENMQLVDAGIAGYLVSRRIEKVPVENAIPFSAIIGEKERYALSFLTDSAVIKGNIYSYAVQTVDTNGLSSKHKAMITVSLNDDQPIAPLGLSAINTGSGIKLEWHQIVYQEMQSYRLYRYREGQAPEILSTLPSTALDYTDLSANAGEQYYYCLTTINQKGVESLPTEKVGIRKQ